MRGPAGATNFGRYAALEVTGTVTNRVTIFAIALDANAAAYAQARNIPELQFFQGVVAHQLGHALGLDDVRDDCADAPPLLMNPRQLQSGPRRGDAEGALEGVDYAEYPVWGATESDTVFKDSD